LHPTLAPALHPMRDSESGCLALLCMKPFVSAGTLAALAAGNGSRRCCLPSSYVCRGGSVWRATMHQGVLDSTNGSLPDTQPQQQHISHLRCLPRKPDLNNKNNQNCNVVDGRQRRIWHGRRRRRRTSRWRSSRRWRAWRPAPAPSRSKSATSTPPSGCAALSLNHKPNPNRNPGRKCPGPSPQGPPGHRGAQRTP